MNCMTTVLSECIKSFSEVKGGASIILFKIYSFLYFCLIYKRDAVRALREEDGGNEKEREKL